MIDKKKILAIIPARGGSKGIPQKNIVDLAGKPLIQWTIEAAKNSKYIDRLIVSSDDKEIINVAVKSGAEAPFVRPEELAKDETSGIEPVLHAIEFINDHYDYIIVLQPTSPLRLSLHINEALEQFVKSNSESCVSVTKTDKSPYWMYHIVQNGWMQPVLNTNRFFSRRQDIPPTYTLNGAIYIATTSFLISERKFISSNTRAYIMDKQYSIDIDDYLDLEVAAALINRYKKK